MKKSILFLDDDPVALRLVIDTFKQHFGTEYAYHKAGSAEEAKEVLVEDLARKGTLPTLIVSDWIMPGQRGDEFLVSIGEDYPEIGLVMHSGLTDPDLEARLRSACRLVACLKKPWDGKQQYEAIATALQRTPVS
jgi:CheY-like chemotaxis protein